MSGVVLGGILGALFLPPLLRQAQMYGTFNTWVEIGKLPEAGSSLITGDVEKVYARGTSGTVYLCGYSSRRSGCQPVNEIKQDELIKGRPGPLLKGKPLQILGTKVTDETSIVWMLVDSIVEVQYLLLDDNSIIKWENSISANFNPQTDLKGDGAYCGALIGFITALTLCLVGIGWLRARAKRQLQ
jgi:hypothetical protein